MNDRSQQVADLRARIAAVRSRFGWDQESYQNAPAQPKPVVVEPQPEQAGSVERTRVSDTPKIEPDWDAINANIAKNDAMEAKAAEMAAMKAKLMGGKPPAQIVQPTVAPEPPTFETDWDAIAKNKAKNDAKSAELNAMKAKLRGKQ